MIKIITEIRNKVGIDKTIAFTLLTRIIQAVGGITSIFFITKYLTANEQGYYFTFVSIIAIQIFFELGLSGIITQYTAHEFAHLEWTNDFQLIGEEYYKSRLSSLLRFCVKWFAIISGALFIILVAVGFYFFLANNKGGNIDWQKPWIILCFATSLNLFIDPVLAFFDGLGEVKDMAKVRLIQKTIYIILLYTLFALGFKLYSSAIASVVAIGVNYIQVIYTKRLKLLKIIWFANAEWVVSYAKEIFPLQWKIALSWISGYFIFQLFVPVTFSHEGPVIAGRMGMTLTALSGVLSISMSWINPKIPLFSELIAKKNYTDLDSIFFKTVKQSCAICAAGLFVLISAVVILQHATIAIGYRFLSPFLLILLCISSFVNQLVGALATYLRCHKEEPFLLQSVVLAILSTASTLLLGKYFGVTGIVIGYTCIIVFLSLTWTLVLFTNKKREWHQL